MIFRGHTFFAKAENSIDRSLARAAKFRYDEKRKLFYTKSHFVASRLRDHADDLAKTEIARKIIDVSPWTGSLLFPPWEEPKDFQPNVVTFALERNRSYLALDPGLGKTPISVMVSNSLIDQRPTYIVYLCPPFLTRNVAEEFHRWRTFETKVQLFNTPDGVDYREAEVLIIPDSIIHDSDHMEEIRFLISAKKDLGYRVQLFVDEAHRFKNSDSERSKALLGYQKPKTKVPGLADRAERITYLSGTPVPNRLMELFAILEHSAPETIDFMNRFDYGMKYCGGYDTGFGFDFNGGTKETAAALALKVKGKFMLRLRKSVLNLPPKIEEILVLSKDMGSRLSKMDSAILAKVGGEDKMQELMRALAVNKKIIGEEDELHLATYRRLLGDEKAAASAEVVDAILEETDEAVVLFAYHRNTIERLTKLLKKWNPIVITGETPAAGRHELVKLFQNSGVLHRLIIANYVAAGVGFTLTKATRAEFCEYDWVPGVNDQASDRLHRIGQKNSVYVRYHVFRNSVDKVVLESNLRKRKVTNQI